MPFETAVVQARRAHPHGYETLLLALALRAARIAPGRGQTSGWRGSYNNRLLCAYGSPNNFPPKANAPAIRAARATMTLHNCLGFRLLIKSPTVISEGIVGG